MTQFRFSDEESSTIRDILGYLNFASGQHDPRFWQAWDRLFAALDRQEAKPVWKTAFDVLTERLTALAESGEAFRQADRAMSALNLLCSEILPGYRRFHADLLFHQTDEFLFTPFFIARCAEILLTLEAPWTDRAATSAEVIRQVNDFLGYRPIPILEGEEKHEPNPHEWVAPLPLYRQNAGAVEGPYHDLVEKTLEILRSTDPVLLRDAWFDPDKLVELALDPRAFDFDHPVNRRPNYHFGTWDPHLIDADGYYRRFIIHQVTVDAILQRIDAGSAEGEKGEVPQGTIFVTPATRVGDYMMTDGVPREQLLFEAAAVLAGTILMGSGVTGDHVQSHDSTVSLNTLMPQIASYRDRFYELLIQKVPETMRPRLEDEAKRLFQPFGAARQDLNKRLAKRRADQLQRLHLARLFARMGYFDAAERQTEIISVASARILCRIDCLITQAYDLADDGKTADGGAILVEIEDLLHRGIRCGALPDPWSLLGFGAQYSLFPAADNTVHDHRIDDLIDLLNDIFDLYSRLLKEAAASGNADLQADLSDRMSDLAGWWDQFGSTDVSSVEGFSGQAVWESAAKVATALAVWHKAGTAAGDVAFWSRHVERFSSPKAFVLLGEALLDRKDPVSTMALLMHWLSSSETIPLTEGDYSFHSITFRWIEDLWKDDAPRSSRSTRFVSTRGSARHETDPIEYVRLWTLTKTFLERMEANAGDYWDVPHLTVDPDMLSAPDGDKSDGGLRGDRESAPEKDFVFRFLAAQISDIFSDPGSEIGRRVQLLLDEKDFQQKLENYSDLELAFREALEDGNAVPLINIMKMSYEKQLRGGGSGEADGNESDDSETEELDLEIPPMKIWFDLIERSQILGNDDENGEEDDSESLSERFSPLDESSYDWIDSKNDGDADSANLFGETPDEEDEEIGIDPTFQAAYDNMSFRDSAEDGVEDEMMEGLNDFSFDEDELAEETDRINDRLAFLFSLMKLWKFAAGKSPLLSPHGLSDEILADAHERIRGWLTRAERIRIDLERLLAVTAGYRIPKPRGTSESLMEYDQQHGTKEILLDRIIRTSVEVNDAILFLKATLAEECAFVQPGENLAKTLPAVFAAIFRSDVRRVKRLWPSMLAGLETETLLYIPTSRGGSPDAIVRCRSVQQTLLRLLEYAPRLGLLTEEFQLLATVQKMERIRPNRPGAITEFDRIFETATRSVAQCIIDSSTRWRFRSNDPFFKNSDQALVLYMERTMDLLLGCWLSHSQHIRISSVEGILGSSIWEGLKAFIQKYGSDIFTQNFLSFRNLRAILHQGVGNYLQSLLRIRGEERELESGELLIDDLANERIPMRQAVFYLELVFECIAENYSEYIDYNSTTTHSDHGEKIYMLLDMLRVLTQYERIAWNLKPVYWVHQTMIRGSQANAAELWEHSVGKKSINISEENLKNYNLLSARYGVWLPSIYERLAERFVRPLQVDRMCGLVPEAIREARSAEKHGTFAELEKQIEYFALRQTGIGYEVPEWLSALEDEVVEVQDKTGGREDDRSDDEDAFNPDPVFDAVPLNRSDLERQIAWSLENISFREPPDEN